MKNILAVLSLLLVLNACKMSQDSENDKFAADKTYMLRLNLLPGSVYNYEITNETVIEVDFEDKIVENINRTEFGFNYLVSNDSSGNSLLTMTFNKIQLFKKSNDNETELDAENATFSTDQTEKMLGLLKGSELITTINKRGEVLKITGLKEMSGSIMNLFPQTDDNTKVAIEAEWEKIAENGFVKSSLEQLFKLFPDSAIHLGDSWNLKSKQDPAFPVTIIGHYQLKAINNNLAIIESEGKVKENTSMTLQETGWQISQLSGDQQGVFDMETNTGMLINGKIKAKITGNVHVMGKEVPVKIKTLISIKGDRRK
jgi:hypothetical protein